MNIPILTSMINPVGHPKGKKTLLPPHARHASLGQTDGCKFKFKLFIHNTLESPTDSLKSH